MGAGLDRAVCTVKMMPGSPQIGELGQGLGQREETEDEALKQKRGNRDRRPGAETEEGGPKQKRGNRDKRRRTETEDGGTETEDEELIQKSGKRSRRAGNETEHEEPNQKRGNRDRRRGTETEEGEPTCFMAKLCNHPFSFFPWPYDLLRVGFNVLLQAMLSNARGMETHGLPIRSKLAIQTCSMSSARKPHDHLSRIAEF